MQIAVLDILAAIEQITRVPRPLDVLAVAADAPITVMSSAPQPTEQSSPYMAELFAALEAQPSVQHVPFSWRRAIGGRVDVFHSHWPEAKLQGPTPAKTWLRHALFALMVLNFRMRGTAVVQTMHNVAPHESQHRITRHLIGRFHRLTRIRISINDATGWTPGPRIRTILHGHLKNWYAPHRRAEAEPDRMVFVGLIREYKAVPELARVFTALDGPYRLHVAGRPDPASLGAELQEVADRDPRIDLDLGFVTDPDLVTAITRAALAVLPYRELHNSGAAMSALSLDRPILVPDNDSTRRLAAEVGEGWVITFEGELTGEVLRRAVEQAAVSTPAEPPRLDRRNWDLAGAQHAAAFHEAVIQRRPSAKDAHE